MLGTGIGGALIINGNLFDGSSFDAGDFGHHVIRSGDDDAFDCVCGKRGCFEVQASADGLVRHYRKQLLKLNKERNKVISTGNVEEISLHQNNVVASSDHHDINNDSINAEKVVIMMRQGNEAAKQAFHVYMDDLSSGLANLVTFYNPDTIALGGGLSQATEIYKDIQRLVDSKTLPATRGKVKIVPCLVGVDAGAIGAALLAKSNCQK